MASLNVHDNVVTVFDGSCSFVFETPDHGFKTLEFPSSGNIELKTRGSQDQYLGLTRHCSALSSDGELYAAARERDLVIWSTRDWIVRSSKLLERSPSKILFTPSGESIIVADKTGDVYLFKISDDSASKGILLMGHLSILLDVAMTADEMYIVTCDRDEKIRVTRYPQTYEIERFCLGHSAFVTKVVLLNADILLSSSGDGSLKFWKFLQGECVSTYSVNEESTDLESEPRIITNVAVLGVDNSSSERIICLSVRKLDGVLVYRCNLSDLSVKHVQTVNCDEPFDIVTRKSFLWILKYSKWRALNALQWDGSSRQFVEYVPLEKILNIANEKCSHLCERSHIDLSVLCKMYALKEKSSKKIKTSLH